MADRLTLLSTGVPMQSLLGTFGPYSLGQTAQIRLRNVGVLTGLSVRVVASLAITGTMTASPLGPYPLIAQHITSDYNTTTRISAPGGMLYMLNSIRHGRPWMPTGQGLVDTLQTAQPTAVSNPATLEYNVDIPFAVDPGNDLTGAILAQTVVGEMFYKMQFASALVGDAWSAPYTAGTATVNSIYVTVWQRYIQPQNASLPLMDLNTVYEFDALYNTQNNITTNGQTYINYPNVRSVLGAYYGFVDNAGLTVNGTDISALTLIANGNTRMREQDPLDVRKHMRIMLGGDLPASLYFVPSRRQPIQTWIYSQVQELFNWGTLTSSPVPYLNYGFESIYPLNTPLPGIAAASS
jgi:hypothetical protein